MLEAILNEEDLELSLGTILYDWLEGVCDLTPVWDRQEMIDGKGIDINTLIEYATTVRPLLARCLPKYAEEDKLRTKAGGVLSDPLNFPSAQFSQEYNNLNLWSVKSELDVSAQRQHPDFSANSISISSVVAKSLNYALAFTYPENFARTLEVELSLNTAEQQAVELISGLPWTGFVDWIYEDKEGGINIVDHKTNKLLPNELEVVHHDQLNIYAALYYEIFGKWVERIGIQHLPSDTLVTAEVNPEIAKSIYHFYRQLAVEIVNPARTSWLKRLPNKQYDGVCVKRMGTQLQICPALSTCWPHFNPAAIA